MPNYFKEDGDAQIIGVPYGRGGGYGGVDGGLGGIGAIIALVVVVAILWFLAREGKNNDGCYNGGYAPYPYPPYPYGGGNCNSNYDCKIQMTPDMSVCELDKDLWKVDSDVWKSACETQKTVTTGNQLILDKLCASENQALRDKLAEAYAEKSTADTKYFVEKKVSDLEGLILKMDNQNDKQVAGLAALIEKLSCGLPKLPPVWAEGITPNTHHTDCHDFPRRSKGCCDDGYSYA